MKKNTEKNKKIILGGLLAGGLVLASYYGTGLQKEQETRADAAISEAVQTDASITGEIPAKRDRFAKQFAMSDGSYTCRYILYAGPL